MDIVSNGSYIKLQSEKNTPTNRRGDPASRTSKLSSHSRKTRKNRGEVSSFQGK